MEKSIETLFWASKYGDLNVVKEFVEIGIKSKCIKNIVLYQASENGHLEIVEYLLENNFTIKSRSYALPLASMNGHLEIVKCLIEAGAKIYCRKNLALRNAIKGNHLDIIEYLLENGAKANTWNSKLLYYASNDARKLLIKYGADKNVLRIWENQRFSQIRRFCGNKVPTKS